MRMLLPEPADQVDLAQAYAFPEHGRWLRANMVSSVDGAVSLDGTSVGLGGPADRRVFATLRGLADVVLVGSGTAAADGYAPIAPDPERQEPRRSLGQLPAPVIAVVSGSLQLDLDSSLFTEAYPPTIVITHSGAPAEARSRTAEIADLVVAGENDVDLAAALGALGDRGYRRINCEGGPGLLASLATAGLLDELCLTLSPLLVGGDAGRITHGALLDPPADHRLAHVLTADGRLFCSYVRP